MKPYGDLYVEFGGLNTVSRSWPEVERLPQRGVAAEAVDSPCFSRLLRGCKLRDANTGSAKTIGVAGGRASGGR